MERTADFDADTRIKCDICGVSRMINRFSRAQIKKYRENSTTSNHNRTAPTLPTCVLCTAGNVVELECTGCHMIKDLGFFSKRQRQKPDNALCLDCQQEVLDRVPDLQDQLEEEELTQQLEENDKRASALSSVSGPHLAFPSTTSMSMSGTHLHTSSKAGDGVFVPGQYGSAWGIRNRSIATTNTATSTVSDTASHAASHDMTRTKAISTGGGNWTKQQAVLADVATRAASQVERNQRRKNTVGCRPADDSEEEDFEL